METERDLLLRARDLIKARQFDDARAILSGLPDSATAQAWLAKLDTIAPPPIPTSPPLRAGVSTPASAPGTIHLTMNTALLRYLVGGITALMALVMLAGFFLFSWLDLGEINLFGMSINAMSEGLDVDRGELNITAMEIWMGRNSGQDFTLDAAQSDGGGIADVRLLDRFLIFIPVLALVLIWLAWIYTTDSAQARPALAIMTALALVLLIFPFAWEQLSENNWENAFKGAITADTESLDSEFDLDFSFGLESMFAGMMTSTYSTGEHKLAAGIATLFCLVGLALEYMGAPPPPRRSASPPGMV